MRNAMVSRVRDSARSDRFSSRETSLGSVSLTRARWEPGYPSRGQTERVQRFPEGVDGSLWTRDRLIKCDRWCVGASRSPKPMANPVARNCAERNQGRPGGEVKRLVAKKSRTPKGVRLFLRCCLGALLFGGCRAVPLDRALREQFPPNQKKWARHGGDCASGWRAYHFL